MQFPFTFSLNVPGLHNPFLAKSGPALAQPRIQGSQINASPRFPPATVLSPPVPLARKRGWIPAEPAPSRAAPSSTSTTGYLDTPAKYRDMLCPEQEVEEMIAELPPAKRRRSLAGSIVSTALSAALIGTAVGLTVYRLWRDRGKQPDQLPPPPPYQRGDWTPDAAQPSKHPSSPKPRVSRHTSSATRRPVARHSRKPRKLQTITPPRSVSPPSRSESDYVHVNHRVDEAEQTVEPDVDEMDWIGDRLTRLIQEGQKALGREIVVMSEVKEDEFDDGSDVWEEDAQLVSSTASPSVSRCSSVRSLRRTHKPRNLPPPPFYTPHPISPPSSASPRKRHFEPDSSHRSPVRSSRNRPSMPNTPRRSARGTSSESDAWAPIVSSFKEDETAWQSPELRESMERARARYLQREGA